MPELPEVETIVRDLRPQLVDRSVDRVHVLQPDVLRQTPDSFSAALRRRRVESVARRGKNIVVELAGGRVLLVNLGMTGRLFLAGAAACATHPAVRFVMDQGPVLVFDDVRRFGALEVLARADWARRSRGLGPEPLSPRYRARHLYDGLSRSSSPIRSWLLDQRRVAGIGNIYANEALHMAGIHPRRLARSLNEAEARALHRAMRKVLRGAIRNRGTTLRDYRDASGQQGSNAGALAVYARDGEPCLRCSTEIRRLVFGNRSAFYCQSCQPEEAEWLP